ncbi:MAG: monovalent cation/H(+) antiporter subunit G [Rhodospirillales bacterium]|nr:monovalent cation/H(+) antiporter subunit G [Rhodospirillales bacterium]
MIITVLSWICILIGSAFLIIGSIGLLRLPDFYTRMHAAGIMDTMGTGFMILGMMLQAGFTLVTIKLALIVLFLFFAGPAATHALAQAALSSGLKPLLAEQPEDDGEDKGAAS